MVDPTIAPSALKHGLDERSSTRVPQPDPGLGPRRRITMLIGANAAAIVLEVGYTHGETAVVIVHAMPATEKFLR